MKASCRVGLYIVSLIACISSASAENKSASASTPYDKYMQPYTAKARSGSFPGPKGDFDRIELPLNLIVTGIVGDEPKANALDQQFDGPTTFGTEVSTDWQVYHFNYGPSGGKGSGYWKINDADQKRLRALLSKLPDDGQRLPPPGRRVILQVPEGDHCRARIYDRANAPDEVYEILRLSLTGIRSWMPTINSESDVTVGGHSIDGILALTPKGQLVTATENGPLKFWDPLTHEQLKDVRLPSDFSTPETIKFSPDGSLAVLADAFGDNRAFEAKTWKIVKNLRQPSVGRYGVGLFFTQFTADGRFVTFLCTQFDTEGHHLTILPRAYDTKTWKQYDKQPDLPQNALACVQARKGRRAIVLLKGNTMVLWNLERGVQSAKLDEHVRIHEVAFSPDESMVAIATGKDGKNDWMYDNIKIWKMDTGEQVHRLRPFEADTCETVVGLQWTPDGHYVLAATKSDGSFDDCAINIWNVKSGRHRGTLVDGLCHPTGIAILPDGKHVAAGGVSLKGAMASSVIRFWDLSAALKQIRSFEDSLEVKPRK